MVLGVHLGGRRGARRGKSRVQVCAGHTVIYDRRSIVLSVSIHIAGTLRFATDRDMRLDVGLIKIQAGEGDDASENGFDCDAHVSASPMARNRPALEVGTADHPIPADHTALIRLIPFDDMDRESCPAIVCCGGANGVSRRGSVASVGQARLRCTCRRCVGHALGARARLAEG